MPGATAVDKPLAAGACSYISPEEEAQRLDHKIQSQYKADIARIFDEEIHPDREVLCGKNKIPTHSCILKTRTRQFYDKIETLPHVNFGRHKYDEVYSFISDAYTDCNIQDQEKEIVKYLIQTTDSSTIEAFSTPGDKEFEAYGTLYRTSETENLTPDCVKFDERIVQKTLSTTLKSNDYSLAPIDGNILDKELNEQDELSNSFRCINKLEVNSTNEKSKPCIKPTSLCLGSGDTPKIPNHSSSCDILTDKAVTDKTGDILHAIQKTSDASIQKFEPKYSPDSLAIDEPSSSSDYLSAVFVISPEDVSSSELIQLNVREIATKMENIITISDSGLENNETLESLNSHKDFTLKDLSLTESIFHEILPVDETNGHDSSCSHLVNPHIQNLNVRIAQKNCLTDMSGTPTKEDNCKENEGIVILESSSLSSETGSWESAFPPKLPEKVICEKVIINREPQIAIEGETRNNSNKYSNIQPRIHDELCPSLVLKLPFKSTSCFIDAATLADEGDDVITEKPESSNIKAEKSKKILIDSSRPVPCESKKELSPNDWSESIDNDDSLELTEYKDGDVNQKDLSPTIFDMTPITEDSLCNNALETVSVANRPDPKLPCQSNIVTKTPPCSSALGQQNIGFSTPNNSIISVRSVELCLKAYESEESVSGISIVTHDSESHNSSPIINLITPREKSVNHNKLIDVEAISEKYQIALSNSPFWVVDMSSSHSLDGRENTAKCEDTNIRSLSKLINSVDNCKSQNTVETDGSEKSAQKFYIDLSTLSDTAPEQKHECDDNNEKKNIFSMFIDLGNEPAIVKEMPARLSSSLNTKKTEVKYTTSKDSKTVKSSNLHSVTSEVTSTSTPETIMFENLESLCNDPSISIKTIITAPIDIIKNTESYTDDVSEVTVPTIKANDIIKHEVKENNFLIDDLFVKLSDLDKPSTNTETDKKECHERMTRSIPDNDWRESTQTINSSSFHSENALSLNRLFPNLKNDFSKSMPGCLSSRTKSPMRLGFNLTPGDIDEHASDVSEMSSVQSSYCRSVVGNSTTEETSQCSSLISSCQSRLGQDLLRMFLEEIATDVLVEVNGRRIKAHKCILSSRCQYFAAILSGSWVESSGNVIVLPSFSFNVVHFALCHIYSGVSKIPDSINLVELSAISDLLCLDGLKEVIMFTLKAKYCHHFHRPCVVCTVGVMDCFPLTSIYGLDDLYRKCLRWITRYFDQVWPTKAFASLPSDLMEKCYQEHIIHFSIDTVVETIYGCGITVASLPSSRWSETVARMCRRVVKGAARYTAARLSAVVQTTAALPADPPPAALNALEDCMAAAIAWAPPKEACRTYALLSQCVRHAAKPDLIDAATVRCPAGHLLHAYAPTWRLQCESALVQAAPRVVNTQEFKELPAELRKRLRELGCIVYGAQASTSVASQHRKTRYVPKANHALSARTVDIDKVRAAFVPYAPKPPPQAPLDSPPSRGVHKPKTYAMPKVRTTKAQEERAKYNSSKNAQLQERLNSKVPAAYRNTRPLYLESRMAKKENMPLAKKPLPKMMSSSESSRNTSPSQTRAGKARRAGGAGSDISTQRVSQNSLASRPRTADPSTDSLTESQNSNKYATYTKTKHNAPTSVTSAAAQAQTKRQLLTTTRIPVLQKSNLNSICAVGDRPKGATKVGQREVQPEKSHASTVSSVAQPKSKANERKPSASLMNATKSSQAKVVPKISKDGHTSKNAGKTNKCKVVTPPRSPPPEEIPIMERSGTFLKDEPMFGDKTINIDE